MTVCTTDFIWANYSDIKLREHWDSQHTLYQDTIFDKRDSLPANLRIIFEGLPQDSLLSFNTHRDTGMNVAGLTTYAYKSSFCSNVLTIESILI
jgi:hypothetical protein